METTRLGTLIRERREARGWTQTRLAAETGIDRPTLSQIERGATKLPSAETRRRLAATLGLRHIDLLIAAGEITPQELPGYEVAPDTDELDEALATLSREERRQFAWLIGSVGRQAAAQERRRLMPIEEPAQSGTDDRT